MKLTRKEFLLTTAGALGAGAVLPACGDDGDGGGACSVAITANHGHSLTVAQADIDAGVEKTFSIKGGSSHAHEITITSADFTVLNNGQGIQVRSTDAAGHTHDVTVLCS